MSTPFGGHPTFAQYIGWAIKQGLDVKSGVAQNADGDTDRVTVISSQDGKRWVVVVGIDQREFLVPTTIAQFDRRLGIESPWFSIDETGAVKAAK